MTHAAELRTTDALDAEATIRVDLELFTNRLSAAFPEHSIVSWDVSRKGGSYAG